MDVSAIKGSGISSRNRALGRIEATFVPEFQVNLNLSPGLILL